MDFGDFLILMLIVTLIVGSAFGVVAGIERNVYETRCLEQKMIFANTQLGPKCVRIDDLIAVPSR